MNFNPGMAREWQDDGCPHGYQKVINLQELVDVWQTPKRYSQRSHDAVPAGSEVLFCSNAIPRMVAKKVRVDVLQSLARYNTKNL
mmetsp:Transcript_10059/g.22051  ORF Transcript_10059/g.22051 Transcript_10059/m.22051 type:complete len:85 (+) Transcript_10059:3375-3629(+)